MKANLQWQEQYNIGVEVIDSEHQRLYRIINKLFAFCEDDKDSQWTCQEGIKFFKSHAIKHFADEEEYMASINYPFLEQHQFVHRDFRENILPALEQELEQTNYAPDAVEHFLSVCTGWLVGHTLTEDQAIATGDVSIWEDLLPDEEVDLIKKSIKQLIFDMFRLESQVISDAYGGEKFGNGVYYRLVYGKAADEKKQEVILVFEENLLINTVGKVLGLKTNQLDSMLINAARHTARQFVRRIREHFPSMAEYELQEENLLSYEQFSKVFSSAKPQVSLLLNTGGGYFAFCMIAPHLLDEGVGTPIERENAMDEVEKYLSRHETQKKQASAKPVILVVDDSITMRCGMKDLLEPDYEVIEADSGIGAIRAITLHRPDLVLLDYEMPVCDGRQTLAMLRSESSFEGLPVIFLTGRSDPEAVRSLLSLKPSGYLLKDLKKEDIKKKIDAWFTVQK